jgi:hypothetical protein
VQPRGGAQRAGMKHESGGMNDDPVRRPALHFHNAVWSIALLTHGNNVP